MNSGNNFKISIGFSTLLTIVFVVLKLLGVLDWSWAWVLSPIWITALMTAAILIGCAIIIVFSKSVS